MDSTPEITDAMREKAKTQPGSYLYIIDSAYAKNGPDGAIPPQGIVGAYPVDMNGEIAPKFQRNPNYQKPNLN